MRFLIGCFLAIPTLIGAMELYPWSGRDFEFHPRMTQVFQTYPSHRNYFLGLGVEGSYDVWQADLEVNLAHTEKLTFGFNDFRLTGRYRWMNDIVGEPVTINTGVTFIKATHHSLRDYNLFHHGVTEVELHAAMGKEFECGDNWSYRFWGVGALGIANRGFPWVRVNLGWEKNWWDQYVFGLFIDTLWGLGHRRLHIHDFHGYGPVRHQSVDIGVKYEWLSKYDSVVTVSYAYRPYASNFPEHVNTFLVQWMIPFGI